MRQGLWVLQTPLETFQSRSMLHSKVASSPWVFLQKAQRRTMNSALMCSVSKFESSKANDSPRASNSIFFHQFIYSIYIPITAFPPGPASHSLSPSSVSFSSEREEPCPTLPWMWRKAFSPLYPETIDLKVLLSLDCSLGYLIFISLLLRELSLSQRGNHPVPERYTSAHQLPGTLYWLSVEPNINTWDFLTLRQRLLQYAYTT